MRAASVPRGHRGPVRARTRDEGRGKIGLRSFLRVRRLRAVCVIGKLQPMRRAIWIVAFAVYAAVAIEVGVRRGSDFEAELGQSERLLHGTPLFAGVSTRIGLPWPPFSAVALTPFALVARANLGLSKAMWAALSLACLVWSVCRVPSQHRWAVGWAVAAVAVPLHRNFEDLKDRKSTRLNSSHRCISYAVFCLKKKKQTLYKI